MLAAGGSAADAAVAVQMVLTLVEPQTRASAAAASRSTGTPPSATLASFDGRETAPAAATPDYWLDADGAPLEFCAAVAGGRSVGVPGTLQLMETLHARYGRLPWGELFEPAIAPRRGRASRSRRASPPPSSRPQATGLDAFPATRSLYFHQDGTPQGRGRDPDATPTSPAPCG